MKLTAIVKLNTTSEQFKLLKQTLEQANSACNYISKNAWDAKIFGQYNLHKLVYNSSRANFPISAQVVVRCISKVADAYKLNKNSQRTFEPYGSIAYDDRILTWYIDKQVVNIWAIGGRIKLSYSCGERQKYLLQFQQGESDLVLRNGEFYLFTTCNTDDPAPKYLDEFIGYDFGIVNILTSSDGEVFSGKGINALRARHRKLRAKLQSKKTKSAKRLLEKRNKKEANFAKNTNHVISKKIVATAKDTNRAIALEDLTGINSRITVFRKPQRATHSSWSFYQLRKFIEYKAKLAGIPVIAVDPRNTSRTCPECGCVDKRNRPNQETFKCVNCSCSGLADYIAAGNISRRASINMPYASAA